MAFIEWLGFSVGLSIAPTFLILLIAWLTNRWRGWVAVLRDGQLFLFSTTLCATTLYDIHKSTNTPSDVAGLAYTGVLFVLLSSACVYGVALAYRDTVDTEAPGRIALTSVVMALAATLVVIGLRRAFGLLP